MNYDEFVASIESGACPEGLEPNLRALWYEGTGDWHTAHQVVQTEGGRMAARIHAYLHRKEGDDWNSRYWHRQAGSTFPSGMSLEEEWESLVRELVEP